MFPTSTYVPYNMLTTQHTEAEIAGTEISSVQWAKNLLNCPAPFQIISEIPWRCFKIIPVTFSNNKIAELFTESKNLCESGKYEEALVKIEKGLKEINISDSRHSLHSKRMLIPILRYFKCMKAVALFGQGNFKNAIKDFSFICAVATTTGSSINLQIRALLRDWAACWHARCFMHITLSNIEKADDHTENETLFGAVQKMFNMYMVGRAHEPYEPSIHEEFLISFAIAHIFEDDMQTCREYLHQVQVEKNHYLYPAIQDILGSPNK